MGNEYIDKEQYPIMEPPSGNAKQLIVFLHGVGSDGHDLISLAPYFQNEMPDAYCISPNAPNIYDMAPYGYQWFSLKERKLGIMRLGAEKSFDYLTKIITDKQTELGLTNKDTYLVGFSQGAATGMLYTLSQEEPFAMMVAYSGFLIKPDTGIRNHDTPICLIHGEKDDVVEPRESKYAAEYFNLYNVENEILIIPNLKHSIDAIGIGYGSKLMNKYLNNNKKKK